MRLSGAPWREAVARAERWFLPGDCLTCHQRDPADQLICALCRTRWQPVPEPVCIRCGQPRDRDVECRICAAWPGGLGRVRSAVWLEDRARRAVHLLKYEGWWRVAGAMVRPMAGLESLRSGALLVPIPLGRARERARGYNQSTKLADALGALTGLGVEPGCLVRGRETPTQTRLTPEERAANLRRAFRATRPPAHAVLVDDVFTTGATLVSAAEALLEAGTERVSAVTFARALPPLAAVNRLV